MFLYKFTCEGKDSHERPWVMEREYVHETEEEARRDLIYTLNQLYSFYPRKITLKSIEDWSPSPLEFD